MTPKAPGLAAVLVSTLIGCRTAPDAPVHAHPAAVISSVPHTASLSAEAKLASMDGRTALPLLPMMANHQKQNMRDHLIAVQEIVAAVGAKDFDSVSGSASRIGFSAQMGRMCEHMGAGAAGFTDLALKFHHTADKIGEAAKAHDSESVLRALSDTLEVCTSCHQTYRQQVVDDTAWSAVTNAAATGPLHD